MYGCMYGWRAEGGIKDSGDFEGEVKGQGEARGQEVALYIICNKQI